MVAGRWNHKGSPPFVEKDELVVRSHRQKAVTLKVRCLDSNDALVLSASNRRRVSEKIWFCRAVWFHSAGRQIVGVGQSQIKASVVNTVGTQVSGIRQAEGNEQNEQPDSAQDAKPF
jgi:hypothetical protein